MGAWEFWIQALATYQSLAVVMTPAREAAAA